MIRTTHGWSFHLYFSLYLTAPPTAMGNNTSRPGVPTRRRSAPAGEEQDHSGFAPLSHAQTEPNTDTKNNKDDDAASIAPSMAGSFAGSTFSDRTAFSERTLFDNASLYSTTGTVLDESIVPPSDAIRAGMAEAMEALNGEKGWTATVATAQLEWLAQDAGRRARWLRAEVAMQQRRAKRGKRGVGRRGSASKQPVINLSLAGEERAREEDAAVVRRLAMERMAGEHRARSEELAREMLEQALAEHPLPPPCEDGEADDARRALEAQIRGLHKEARDQYHASCKDAADAHATGLENAKIAHTKAYSAAKIRYMGATLRAPDLPTSGMSLREASVGPIWE